uniref:Uncharacterized protein n=1 Tax=Anguilla anguilla TaxID=7936 RepID=A0A0E9TNH8_ANGAN
MQSARRPSQPSTRPLGSHLPGRGGRQGRRGQGSEGCQGCL